VVQQHCRWCPIQAEKSFCFAQATLMERLWLSLFFLPAELAVPASTILQGMAASLRFYSLGQTVLHAWDCRCAMQAYSYRVIRSRLRNKRSYMICVRTINYSSIMMVCLRSAIRICMRIINYSPIHICQLALPSPRQLPRGSG